MLSDHFFNSYDLQNESPASDGWPHWWQSPPTPTALTT